MKMHLFPPMVLLLLFRVSAQQIGTVDLTRVPPAAVTAQTQEGDAQREGCEKLEPGIIADGFVEPKDHKPHQIALEIIKVSDEKPTIGSELQADVRLLNSGGQPVEIPWSTDPNLVLNGQ